MAAAEPKKGKLKRTRNRRPNFIIGCPLTHNRSSWCNAFCTPMRGRGPCGRIAPHRLRGRTQRAIDRWKRAEAQKQSEES
jgi:hypothetical protein